MDALQELMDRLRSEKRDPKQARAAVQATMQACAQDYVDANSGMKGFAPRSSWQPNARHIPAEKE
jgi:hypothetical protein